MKKIGLVKRESTIHVVKMSKEYTLESMIETFGKHYTIGKNDRMELMKKVEAGEIDMSDWMKDTFSISLALQTICKEIKALKDAK